MAMILFCAPRSRAPISPLFVRSRLEVLLLFLFPRAAGGEPERGGGMSSNGT